MSQQQQLWKLVSSLQLLLLLQLAHQKASSFGLRKTDLPSYSSLYNYSCFPSIFSFGDSKADTGNYQAAYSTETRSERLPYGITYFGHSTDRFCDGRLVIDFQAQAYGLPLLSPYMGSINTDFRQGANFAQSNSAVIPGLAVSPFYLTRQFNHFKKLKSHYGQKQLEDPSYMPPNVYFGEGLYVISTGENDYRVAMVSQGLTAEEIKAQLVPVVVNITSTTVKGLYEEGARKFLVIGIAADGCISRLLTLLPHDIDDLDSLGCQKSVNDYVQYHNEQLQNAVKELREELSDAEIAYGDYYGINVEIINNASSYGFTELYKACCGYGGDYNFNNNVQCAQSGEVDGVYVNINESCADPSQYINWDGIHLTEHFYEVVALAFLQGRFVDQPIALPSTCTLDFSDFPHAKNNLFQYSHSDKQSLSRDLQNILHYRRLKRDIK